MSGDRETFSAINDSSDDREQNVFSHKCDSDNWERWFPALNDNSGDSETTVLVINNSVEREFFSSKVMVIGVPASAIESPCLLTWNFGCCLVLESWASKSRPHWPCMAGVCNHHIQSWILFTVLYHFHRRCEEHQPRVKACDG